MSESLHFKIIINCGPCVPYIQQCIRSLSAQTWTRWEAFVTVDPYGDQTYETALAASGGDGRFHIVQNTRKRC